MRQRLIRQNSLFEVIEASPVVELPAAVREEVAQRLQLWIQALAKAMAEERADEQD